MLQDRTEKVPNVPSEFLEKMSFSQPFPLFQSPISSPAAAAAAPAAAAPAAAAAQKHLPAPKQPLLLLLLLLTEESKSTSRHQNSKARKDEHATESHRKSA